VFESLPAREDVERDVQDVVGFVVGEMAFEGVQSRHCHGFPWESRGFLPTRAFSSTANATSILKNEPASR
jgi:hypothetical protein